MSVVTASAAAPSAALLTLLRCLDREDVSQLQLCSGELAQAQRRTGLVALTKTPLTEPQIQALLQGTPLAQALTSATGTPRTLNLMLAERPVQVVVSRVGSGVQVAIARANQGEPTATSAAAPPPMAAHPPSRAAALADAIALSSAPSPPVAAYVPPTAHTDNAIDLGWSPQPITQAPAVAPRQSPPTGPVAPEVSALDGWVALARAARASDVHLNPDEPRRHRSGGQLTAVANTTLDGPALQALARALMTDEQEARLRAVGYVDMAIALPTAGRVRANISRHPKGVKMSLRLVPLVVPTLQTLKLPEDLAAVANYHQGLAIVSGPSGHGKTATLAALIDRINHHSAHHIILIEDPIEVVHPVARALISQREVGRDTASYARALKAALREDPDVIVVGELRDRETVEIALSAAETGHLVLATMNTRSASKTIDRLIDLFPPQDQAQVRSTLAGSLKMVISQRLVPTADGHQVPAVELLTGSVPLWALIRDNKLFQLPSLQQRGRSAGMIRLDTSLLALVQSGQVHPEVARGYAENPAEFDRLLTAGKTPGGTPP